MNRILRSALLLIVLFPSGENFLRAAPVITAQPQSAAAIAGQPVSLTVTASGNGTLHYQWRKLGSPLNGATSSTLSIPSAEFADRGLFNVAVSDDDGTTISGGAEIRVRPRQYPDTLRPSQTFSPAFEVQGGVVYSLLPLEDGGFIAGGGFSRVGSRAETSLAKFHANGSVDGSFHSPVLSGRVIILARQPDGKLLVAGRITARADKLYHDLIRLNPDGSIDASFELFGRIDGVVAAISIQSDGKILIGGLFSAIGASAANNLARLHPNGSLDTSFAPGITFNSTVAQIGLQSGGSILVGGWFTGHVARLLPSGARDNTFPLTLPSPVSSLLVLTDDRILVGTTVGEFTTPALRLLSPGGALLTTFAPSASAGPFESLSIRGLAPQSDGKVVACTSRTTLTTTSATVIRFNSDGSIDPAFPASAISGSDVYALIATTANEIIIGVGSYALGGVAGKGLIRLYETGSHDASFLPPFASFGTISSILPVENGAWLVGGFFDTVNGVPARALVRLTPTGALDPTFSIDTSIRGGVLCLARQGDGRILAGGTLYDAPGLSQSGLLRFEANGQLDATYAPPLPASMWVQHVAVLANGSTMVAGEIRDGGFTPKLFRFSNSGAIESSFSGTIVVSNTPTFLRPRADGSIYVGGSVRDFFGTTFGVLRLTPTGLFDPSFRTDMFSGTAPTALAEQDDGRIVVGANFYTPATNTYRNLARFHADGSRDLSFALASPFNTTVQNIQLHDTGDIIVGGATGMVQAINLSPALARFNGDGSSDTGFAIEGLLECGRVSAQEYTRDNALLVAADMILDHQVTRGLTLLQRVPATAIIEQPTAPSTIPAGSGSVELSVVAESDGELTYQWQARPPVGGSEFVNLVGQNESKLRLLAPQRFDSGTYRVIVTANHGETIYSHQVTLTVTSGTPSPDARLLNLSTRAQALTGDDVLIPGFVIAGTGNKRLLIRAVGPTLGKVPFNLAGTLADPRLRLLKRNTTTQAFEEIAANDNWGTNTNTAAITQTAADVFAFAFNDDREAALLLDLAPGEYTVIAGGVNNATGLVIVELYDADASGAGARLINISNRGFAGVGDQVMIPGFVVSSEGPKTFLIRVVGPTLGGFGVAGTMTDPKLEVFPGGASTPILINDNWGDNPDAAYTAQVAGQVSAFPLTACSKDAAFVVTLPPGSYTVVGSSAVPGGTGVVLVEVYVVP